MLNLITNTLLYVLETLLHNAPWLFFGILVASGIRVYLDPEAIRKTLVKSSGVSIPASVAFGAFTPFCACGTMAIVVSMLTTVLPWGPIMAFLTSSPLMSPDFFILLSGIVGIPFAMALLISSIAIGIGSGWLAHLIDQRTNWLKGQTRFQEVPAASSTPFAMVLPTQSDNTASAALPLNKGKLATVLDQYKIKELASTFVNIGLKQVLIYFSIFAAIGYWINQFVPSEIIMSLFGTGNYFAVPLAALLGIPLYVSGSSSLPLLNSLMAGGASSGVLLAFMITGPGTSMGAIAGILTILKPRAVGLYIAMLFTGAVLSGFLYNGLLALL